MNYLIKFLQIEHACSHESCLIWFHQIFKNSERTTALYQNLPECVDFNSLIQYILLVFIISDNCISGLSPQIRNEILDLT